MSVKYSTKKDGLAKLKYQAEKLNDRKVNVGCLKGSHAWLAAIHEYGCRIKVTPKMRAYLHYMGLHLKPTTTEIVIPERSFIRAGYDQSIDRVTNHAEMLIDDVLDGKMTVDQFLKTVGIELASEIKEYATNLKDPPNSSFTVEQKGSANPLWDTGAMIGGISHEIE